VYFHENIDKSFIGKSSLTNFSCDEHLILRQIKSNHYTIPSVTGQHSLTKMNYSIL